jgi:hypothetical protein
LVQFFFQTTHAGNAVSGPRFTDECGKTIVQGTADAGINNVIYMELFSGPKIAVYAGKRSKRERSIEVLLYCLRSAFSWFVTILKFDIFLMPLRVVGRWRRMGVTD